MTKDRTFGSLMPIEDMLPANMPIEGTPDEARIIAISRILAAEAVGAVMSFGASARQPKQVNEFRTEYLLGQLLMPDRIDAWVRERALKEGEASWWAEVYFQPEQVASESRGGIILAPETTLHYERAPKKHRYLEYATPSDPKTQQAVRAGRALDELRLVSEALHDRCFWDLGQATAFVLTGLIPYSEAYAAYAEERRGRRPREISPKNLHLAVFTAEYKSGPHEGTHEQRMQEWNRLHPEWAFNRVQTFAWVSQDTIRRLVEFG